MKTTGLSFTAAMVQAILAGTKCQTRRIVPIKHRAIFATDGFWYDADCIHPGKLLKLPNSGSDHIYVKETWCPQTNGFGQPLGDREPFYKERDETLPVGHVWKSGRFMPKWAARIWLEVRACRFEPLQDISARDCIAEGIDYEKHKCGCEVCAHSHAICPASTGTLIEAFRDLWDSINSKTHPWSTNPLVVVREFRRIEKP